MIKNLAIEALFEIKSGDFHATKELDNGDIPLISCGDFNNGLVGYFDIPDEKQYSNVITIAYNGRPLTAKFHPYSFGAKDDVAILLPKFDLQEKTLIYIASLFNRQTWRYSYGRKCFKGKLKYLTISIPVLESGEIDETYIAGLFSSLKEHVPEKSKIEEVKSREIAWKSLIITELFELQRGDFHAISKLDKGDLPTVSRISYNNGIVGYFNPPDGANIYPPGLITVSTVTGDAFIQLSEFIATDNVVICIPKITMPLPTLFFVQIMLNRAKWRYSYGRQCYKTKFSQTKIYLPIDDNGQLNHDLMKSSIQNTSYWNYLECELSGVDTN